MNKLTEEIDEIIHSLEKTLQCNCDLDRWEPERTTGHSWVCRIHKAALAEWEKRYGKSYYYSLIDNSTATANK